MENSPELSTICLIALGAAFLIVLGGFLMVRVMRASIFGLGMILMRLLTEGKEEGKMVEVVPVPPHSVNDLRAKAQSLDFEAAVAKYEEQAESPSPTPPSPPDPEDQTGDGWSR